VNSKSPLGFLSSNPVNLPFKEYRLSSFDIILLMSNTVLVDMDGVLAKFDERVVEIIADEYPEIPIPDKREHFYISDDFLPQHREVALSVSDRLGFFASLAVEDGAIEAWAAMLESGYQPRVCSSPLHTHPNSVNEKREWLEEYFVPHFGYSVVDRSIIQSDKTIHRGLALIDDKPVITGSLTPIWERIIYDRPYNHCAEGYRLRGWNSDILLYILQQIENK
jgi:5'-nucleotidase